MTAHTDLGPRPPAIALDTPAVIICGWSLQGDLLDELHAIFIANVKEHAGGHMSEPRALICRVDLDNAVVDMVTGLTFGGEHQQLPLSHTPGMVIDLAVTIAMDHFRPGWRKF